MTLECAACTKLTGLQMHAKSNFDVALALNQMAYWSTWLPNGTQYDVGLFERHHLQNTYQPLSVRVITVKPLLGYHYIANLHEPPASICNA